MAPQLRVQILFFQRPSWPTLTCTHPHTYTELQIKDSIKNGFESQAVAAYTFHPSIQEVEAGGSLSSKPAWSTKQVAG